MAFNATTAIHGAPNEHAMARSATQATTQEALVSMEDTITSAPDRHQRRKWASPGIAGADYKWAVAVIKCTHDREKIAGGDIEGMRQTGGPSDECDVGGSVPRG
jgi:hypothetical protein